MDNFVITALKGKEVFLEKAKIQIMYPKAQRVKNNVLQMQTIMILESKEFGRVCCSTRAKWVKTMNEGDLVDMKVTLNLPGKDLILAKRPKLIKKYV